MPSIFKQIGSLRNYGEAILALGVVGIVLLLIIPLPPVLLDLLISLNILLSMTTLLVTLYIKESLEFSAFPSLLLFLTLFRLGINISSTRMILSKGRAGNIIQTFGQFVSGGNLFIGLVIFALLTIINFIVITKGSGRIAEVAARFALDAMPGKQMAIDADLNAGIINEEEARQRRQGIALESDFYGSMDGASKFVKGDAIAGIVITVINILAGFVVGILDKGMDWSSAISIYTTLSIGDGLVSQIPALLISVGAGIIVTRTSSKEGLGATLSVQVFSDPRVLFVCSGIICGLGLIPGMPFVVMFPISILLAIYGYQIKVAEQEGHSMGEKRAHSPQEKALEHSSNTSQQLEDEENLEKVLFVDLMEIELGYSLLSLVDHEQGGDLLSRIHVIRRQVASELGMIVPSIRIRDNISLEGDHYVIKIKGIEVASGTLQVESFLAMDSGHVEKKIYGIETKEPAFGLDAIWINAVQKEEAEMYGYTVVDAVSVLSTHLTEVIHAFAHELLNRQEVSHLIENAKKYASAVVEELIPNQLPLGQVLRVVQNLLRERIPIRDLVSILEILADHSLQTKEADVLTEYVRQGLSRTISKLYSDENNQLYIISLDPKVEETIMESIQKTQFGQQIILRPQMVTKMVYELRELTKKLPKKDFSAVVLTSPLIRPSLRQLIERYLPRLPVLSFYEIVPDIQIESLGKISSEVLV